MNIPWFTTSMTTAASVALIISSASMVFAEPTPDDPAPQPTTHSPSPSPTGTFKNDQADIYGETYTDLSGSTNDGQMGAPDTSADSNASDEQAVAPKVNNAPPDVKVEVRTEQCTDMSLQQCSAGRTACMTVAGGPAAFKPPTITWVSVNGGGWEDRGLTCGPPESVPLPDGSSVEVDAPPVPTLGQIQEAFRSLPFSKPSASIQPVGLKTLVNLPTYYEATWPDDNGLQPGETSKPLQLLSWSVQFKIAAKEYRYDYGDGTTSEWTNSIGGVYPDGDITHTYDDTGDVQVRIDARLTGQYRVNGGAWQDIATTANLQDEPGATLQVLGTDTKLVAE